MVKGKHLCRQLSFVVLFRTLGITNHQTPDLDWLIVSVCGVQLQLVLDWYEVSVLTGLSIPDEGHFTCEGLVDLR
jgi:hypothetical protein